MSEPYWIPLGAAPAPPAVPGFTLIEDKLLSAAAANIEVASIPQTYAHLRLIATMRSDSGAAITGTQMRMNGDTAANYDMQVVYGAAAGAGAQESIGQTSINWLNTMATSLGTAGFFTTLDVLIPNYRSTVMAKTATGLLATANNAVTGGLAVRSVLGVWRTANAPISSLLLYPAAGNFVVGSRLTLYGLI